MLSSRLVLRGRVKSERASLKVCMGFEYVGGFCRKRKGRRVRLAKEHKIGDELNVMSKCHVRLVE
jgi:hypothetical protein